MNEAEVDQIMFQFQGASTQLESMISKEVTAFALERIGQVLQHALNHGKDALSERALRSSQRDAAPRRSAPTIAARPNEPVPAIAAAGPGAPVTEANSEAERGHHDDGAASEPQHSDQPAVEPTVVETDGEIFQGAVGLTIDSRGDTGGIVDFINELRQEHGVLLTQLTGGSNSTSKLMLRLPAPIAFRDALRRMRGVSDVFNSRGSDLETISERQMPYFHPPPPGLWHLWGTSRSTGSGQAPQTPCQRGLAPLDSSGGILR